MKKLTINNIVQSTLENSKHPFTMGNGNSKITRFVVECGSVKLSGKVRESIYEAQTKKVDGTVLDEVKCSIKTTDDIINRINESINTATKLSKYVKAMTEARKDYLTPGYITEDDDDEKDKELLLDDEDNATTSEPSTEEPVNNLETSLDNMYAEVITLADETINIATTINADEVEPEYMNDIIGYAGTLYSLADDINDTIEDLFPEPEEETESVKRIKKTNTNESKKLAKEVVGKLSEISLMLKDNKEFSDIRESIKIIKTHLIVD